METVYIQLLGDELGTLRPTQAMALQNNLFKVLPIPNYEISDETWEFPPGSTVRCEKKYTKNIGNYLKAVEAVNV